MSERYREVPAVRGFGGSVDPFFRGFFEGPSTWQGLLRSPVGDREAASTWSPAIEITETGEGYAITLEVPGTKAEDIQVECHEHVLTLKGEKRSERVEEDEHRHYTERTFGSFSRRVRLPEDASDDVAAKFSDGVLTINVPKAEERKPRTVAIQS